jgi:hypothetical protein
MRDVTCSECGFLVMVFWPDARVAEGQLPPTPATAEERTSYFLRKGGLAQHPGVRGQFVCFRGIDLAVEKGAPPPGAVPRWQFWGWEDVIQWKRTCRFFAPLVPGLTLQWHLDRQLASDDRKTERRFTIAVALISAVLGGIVGAAATAAVVALVGV